MSPGSQLKPVVLATFSVSGDISSFDSTVFKAKLAELFPQVEHIGFSISTGSVVVVAQLIMPSTTAAQSVVTTLTQATPGFLSFALGVVVESVADIQQVVEVVAAPSPPPPSPPPPSAQPLPPPQLQATQPLMESSPPPPQIGSPVDTTGIASALNVLVEEAPHVPIIVATVCSLLVAVLVAVLLYYYRQRRVDKKEMAASVLTMPVKRDVHIGVAANVSADEVVSYKPAAMPKRLLACTEQGLSAEQVKIRNGRKMSVAARLPAPGIYGSSEFAASRPAPVGKGPLASKEPVDTLVVSNVDDDLAQFAASMDTNFGQEEQEEEGEPMVYMALTTTRARGETSEEVSVQSGNPASTLIIDSSLVKPVITKMPKRAGTGERIRI